MKWLLGGVGVVALVLSGCGDDGEARPFGSTTTEASEQSGGTTTAPGAPAEGECNVDLGATTDEAETTVEVVLGEFTVEAAPETAPAGTVELTATNHGVVHHELLVVRWDGESGTIPFDTFGGVDEEALGDAVQGRIEAMGPQQTCAGTVDLEPGNYALICTLIDDGTSPHYPQGMHTSFTVN